MRPSEIHASEPPTPKLTALQTAHILCEHFAALTQIGFTEQQALVIVGHAMSVRLYQEPSAPPRQAPVGEYLTKLASSGLLRVTAANGTAVA
jgi:hypothetical protein